MAAGRRGDVTALTADGDGGIVIPPEVIESVLAEALAIEPREGFTREKVLEGHPTTAAYPPSGEPPAEYAEWRKGHPRE